MSGLFAGLNLADAPSDPWKVVDGTHKFLISEAPEVKPTAKGDKMGITFKFPIIEGDAGKTYTEWLEIPDAEKLKAKDPDAVKASAFLRKRLDSLGIPPERMDTVEGTEFIGIEGWITVTTNKNNAERQYINISLTAPAEGVTSPSPEIASSGGGLFG